MEAARLIRRAARRVAWRAWLPVWSAEAGLRALRATLVVPGLFALTLVVIGNRQMATYAVFGSFASLVMASFGGSRRDKAAAHLGLAVAGSIALAIGTAVSGTTWLAALVTVPVTFAIFSAGVAGPNAASGITAALLAYVLPVASAAGLGTIPDRLAGWWLASAVSTAAVLAVSRRSAGDRLRSATASLAQALAAQILAATAGRATPSHWEDSMAARRQLMNQFLATPYRPTGLATADRALSSVATLLEWCTSLVCDSLGGHADLGDAAPVDTALLASAGQVLAGVAGLLAGRPQDRLTAELAGLEEGRAASASQPPPTGGQRAVRLCAAHAVHAQAIALTVRAVALDALIAAGRADPQMVAAQRLRWYGESQQQPAVPRWRWALTRTAGLASPSASLRSVWLRNSARGAAALAAAVAVAYLTGVQHGFWVVLGTLSVLRTSAASTGATALRALGGTVAGFAAGAALLLAIGTGPAALWTVLPLAVLVASYAPGTAPFALGQAAFTVTVVVLFNLLAPAGWRIGLVRIEDVGLGCLVSLAVGTLFWPRGAAAVVGDGLADAFRGGAGYLTQAVRQALGGQPVTPGTAGTVAGAGIRLDDALRGYVAEQGAKRMPKEELWTLVIATIRLRLTAYSLAGRPAGGHAGADPTTLRLRQLADSLAAFYESIAAQVGRSGPGLPAAVAPPAPDALDREYGDADPVLCSGTFDPGTVWVRDHLHHLLSHADAITAPALHVAWERREPWWR